MIIKVRHNIRHSTAALTDLCLLSSPDRIVEGKKEEKTK